ncbi:hypothetical protein P170DRAFT_107061 [Aspergillus steynii IBT 23096]|uniref:Uncharacterized protein n=1 Tax=Aspergillus steynii IBT 23096 TaxID=1392250 RepID=A0A2I2GID4_9EURO|nr:uncharacterized protein P170DRAFT_107061 [Aspergillus steynii IBT 23096]PLB52607.1 hypothetical protein P170DRAFT_107061 [Aspergillus steynii IBT 23096]
MRMGLCGSTCISSTTYIDSRVRIQSIIGHCATHIPDKTSPGRVTANERDGWWAERREGGERALTSYRTLRATNAREMVRAGLIGIKRDTEDSRLSKSEGSRRQTEVAEEGDGERKMAERDRRRTAILPLRAKTELPVREWAACPLFKVSTLVRFC